MVSVIHAVSVRDDHPSCPGTNALGPTCLPQVPSAPAIGASSARGDFPPHNRHPQPNALLTEWLLWPGTCNWTCQEVAASSSFTFQGVRGLA